MDLDTLRKLEPARFEDAADGYRALSDMASAAKDHIDNVVVAGMRKSLDGAAAKAARGQLEELSDDFHYTQTECGLVSTALNGFAHDMAAPRKKLTAALAEAAAQHFTVGPDGAVTYPDGPDEVDGEIPRGGTAVGSTDATARAVQRQAANFDPNPHYAAAQGCANDIVAALEEATRVDQKWAPKLRALKADDDLVVSDQDWADVGKDTAGTRDAAADYLKSIGGPPGGGGPQANKEWWDGLTPQEREAYLALQPGTVGKLDGLPADIRDEANRAVLAEEHGRYRVELDGIPKEPPQMTTIFAGMYPTQVYTDEWIEWNKKYGARKAHLESSLRGMEQIQERFDQTGVNGLPEAYLLGFDSGGNGRAIVATGNPDTADHQAVYVPGTTSNLGNIGGNIDHMTELWRRAKAKDPSAEVSTITWLGYDAPQNPYTDSPFRHYADDGAGAYNTFMDGLDVSHATGSDPHRTAIGHSYGTTLIGSAARQGRLDADDVIFAGSPGVEVGSAAEMDVPKGHVWNEEADGDWIPDIGRWGLGGSQGRMGGGVFINPSDEWFGANQMTTAAEGSGPVATVGSHGHSEYWKADSTALRNQAVVVTGDYGDVHLER
ncbi:alpha/beta hydrolase [Streptomyces sp. NPDC050560]|uniref:alpha/beta hydrolase n=1 Tax=Streptomyces sp. NPDC050560 TaxID=3365630 RepID=UPI0037B177C0